MLSTKETNNLKDHLSFELLGAKKAHNHAAQASDKKIKKTLDTLAEVHQQNYVQLLEYVNTQSGGGSQ